MSNSTICAIATAQGIGGISIIRLSGPDAISEVNKYFQNKDLTKVKSHTLNYGNIIFNSELIDEVLVSVMRGPNSFTGEDVVEINCHGGVYVTNLILKELLKSEYIFLAQPGEFSKRAFLNNKKSLQSAKAMNDIINAKTEYAHKIAIHQLNEESTKHIRDLHHRLLSIITQIEVGIDYPEYQDIEEITYREIGPQLSRFIDLIDRSIDCSSKGQLLKNGIQTAIIGLPNVGKSTLLNQLSKTDRAIVTDVAGTTRDTIECEINLGNIVLNLIDTAGIRETSDIVEKIGVDKSKQLINSAQLILFVVDATRQLTNYELELYDIIKQRPHIVLVNKIDVAVSLDYSMFNQPILISAKENINIQEIENRVIKIFDLINFDVTQETIVSTLEDIAKLELIKLSLTSVVEQVELRLPIDIIEIELKECLYYLGEILGLEPKMNLIDEMFSKFCLGK